MPRGRRRRSLRTRIIAWTFFPAAIILTAVALLTFYAYQQVTEDLVLGRNRELTRLSASQLAAEVISYADPLVTLARTADMTHGDPSAQQAALTRAQSRLAVFDAGVVVLDSYGNVVATGPERTDALRRDWSSRGYFRAAFRSVAPVVSDIANDGHDGSAVIVLAAPITGSEGEFVGAVAGMFKLGATTVSSLYGSIVKLRVGDSGSAYLVDSSGRLIYHPDVERIGQAVGSQQVVRDVMAGRVGSTRTSGLDGRDIVASYAPMPGTPWGLVTEENWGSLSMPSASYGRFLLILLIMGMVVPALVVSIGVRRITSPITDLIDAARAVAGGNLGQRIVAKSGDELEDLAAQFNLMSAELQESYTQLERRVADRTRELAALNSISTVVSESLDLDAVLRGALDKCLELMQVDCGMAYQLEGDSASARSVIFRGVSEEFIQDALKTPVAAADTGELAGDTRPSVIAVEEYPNEAARTLLVREGLRQIVSAPLVAKGRLVGAVKLATRATRAFSTDDLDLLEGIGRQVGMAVENARLYEKAEESAAAAERNRLARDLHDAVTQTLFSASLIAEVLPRLWDRHPEDGRRRLEELRQLTRGALAEMRTLLLELRPRTLLETPLGHLVRQLAEATTSRARVPVAATVSGQCPLPQDVQVALYRIAQEALNNVAKHSGASQATIDLRCEPGDVELSVVDDGRGFDTATIGPGSLGVGIMRERAQTIGARLSIESQPGHGTRIVVAWLDEERRNQA